ncbi:MAG: hypothetical protein ACK5XQ_01035, partial [Flavobacteriales bacterium]
FVQTLFPLYPFQQTVVELIPYRTHTGIPKMMEVADDVFKPATVRFASHPRRRNHANPSRAFQKEVSKTFSRRRSKPRQPHNKKTEL